MNICDQHCEMALQVKQIHAAVVGSSKEADRPGLMERMRNQEALAATAKRLFWYIVLGMLAVFGTAIAALIIPSASIH